MVTTVGGEAARVLGDSGTFGVRSGSRTRLPWRGDERPVRAGRGPARRTAPLDHPCRRAAARHRAEGAVRPSPGRGHEGGRAGRGRRTAQCPRRGAARPGHVPRGQAHRVLRGGTAGAGHHAAAAGCSGGRPRRPGGVPGRSPGQGTAPTGRRTTRVGPRPRVDDEPARRDPPPARLTAVADPSRTELVRAGVDAMSIRTGRLPGPVPDVARELAVSERQLRNLFAEGVGLSPSTTPASTASVPYWPTPRNCPGPNSPPSPATTTSPT